MSDYELVRVSREMLEQLITQESPPVVVTGIKRHEDGTCELWFRTVDGGRAMQRPTESEP